MNDSENTKIHEHEVLHVEKETGLRISRMKVPGGWIYSYSYPLGLNTLFIENCDA